MKPLSIFVAGILYYVLIQTAFAQDSLNVTRIGKLPYWEHVANVKVVGNYAYCAISSGLSAGESGLGIVNIFDPVHPVRIAFLSTPGTAAGLWVAEDYAYIADEECGLRVVNISNPTSPVEAGFCDTPGRAYDVKTAGNYAYVADIESGLRIINISNPAQPQEIGFFSGVGAAWAVAVAGNYAYLASDSGLTILDITNPSLPVQVGAYDSVHCAVDVAVSGNIAFLVGYYGVLKAIDIGSSAVPIKVGSFSLPGPGVFGVKVEGNYAYVSDASGLRIINIEDPANMTQVGLYQAYFAWKADIVGNHAYLAASEFGLRIVAIDDPTAPLEEGRSYNQHDVMDVAISGQYAFLAQEIDGLQVVDISDPLAPFLIERNPTWIFRMDAIEIAGNYAYIAEAYHGLSVVDITNPLNPVIAGFCETRDWTCDVTVQGNYAYVADSDSGLRIIDVSNPLAPHQEGFLNTPDNTRSVDLMGNYAYVACGDSGLRIVDVTNPATPVEVGSYRIEGWTDDVKASGNYAYINGWYGSGESGFHIVNIANPTAPFEVGMLESSGSITVSGNYVYQVSNNHALTVIDISNPAAPLIVGFYNTPGRFCHAVVSENYVYVADYSNLSIFDCTAALGATKPSTCQPYSFNLTSYPNPFNPSTTISFTLPQASEVKLAVYDVLGRNVGDHTGSPLRYTAGEHQFVFDGSNLASGIYFVRLQAGQIERTQKLILMK